MELLQFKGVTASLGKVTVVDDVSFCVRSGEVVGLAGRNGSGKSTCIRLLARHVRPSRGEILLSGRPLHTWPTLSRQLVILGDMVGLPPDWSVRQVIAGLPSLLDLDGRELRTAAEELELGPLARKRVSHLSCGQHQRLKLAVALSGRGQLLVLDEPTNGLDAPGKEWLADQLVRRRGREQGVLVVSHEYPELRRYADRLLVLDRRVRYDGSVVEASDYADLLEAA